MSIKDFIARFYRRTLIPSPLTIEYVDALTTERVRRMGDYDLRYLQRAMVDDLWSKNESLHHWPGQGWNTAHRQSIYDVVCEELGRRRL